MIRIRVKCTSLKFSRVMLVLVANYEHRVVHKVKSKFIHHNQPKLSTSFSLFKSIISENHYYHYFREAKRDKCVIVASRLFRNFNG